MRARSARALLPAAVVLALVGVVAVAATGSTPAGTSAGRRPSDSLFDTFFSLALLLLLPAAAMLVYGLMQRRDIAREIATRRYPRTSVGAYLAFVLVFTVVVYFRYRNRDFVLGGDGEVADVGADRGRAGSPTDVGAADLDAYRAELAWIPVLVVVTLATIAGAAYLVSGRRRSAARAPDQIGLAEQLADVLDETLDDLRAEPDPRRAVVAAFARLERAFAAVGVPRARAETADEFVARVLERLDVDPGAVGRLTQLFVQAKFSHHEIGHAMQEDAIDALEHVRDELRLAARRSEDVPEAELAPAARDRVVAS